MSAAVLNVAAGAAKRSTAWVGRIARVVSRQRGEVSSGAYVSTGYVGRPGRAAVPSMWQRVRRLQLAARKAWLGIRGGGQKQLHRPQRLLSPITGCCTDTFQLCAAVRGGRKRAAAQLHLRRFHRHVNMLGSRHLARHAARLRARNADKGPHCIPLRMPVCARSGAARPPRGN
jgi:hypothetical protein